MDIAVRASQKTSPQQDPPAALALSAALLVACSSDGQVVIKTDPNSAPCLLVGFGGVLVADPTYRLALQGTGVIWPRGYSARRLAGKIEILDSRGYVVAREGDNVIMGNPPNNVVEPCIPIEVEHHSRRATGQVALASTSNNGPMST